MSKSFFELTNTNIMVEFRISGESFEPDRITKLLSLPPDEFWLKGDKIRNRNIHRQYCCWSLSTGYKESLDINKEIKQLLSQLEDKKEVLLKIAQDYNANYRISIVINIENDEKPAIFLDSSIINFAHYISAEFDFDLYTYS